MWLRYARVVLILLCLVGWVFTLLYLFIDIAILYESRIKLEIAGVRVELIYFSLGEGKIIGRKFCSFLVPWLILLCLCFGAFSHHQAKEELARKYGEILALLSLFFLELIIIHGLSIACSLAWLS
jgi:hypothetical protein